MVNSWKAYSLKVQNFYLAIEIDVELLSFLVVVHSDVVARSVEHFVVVAHTDEVVRTDVVAHTVSVALFDEVVDTGEVVLVV